VRLQATVRRRTHTTKHYEGFVDDDGQFRVDETPDVCRVEIERQHDGVYLFYFNARGDCIADTWHPTLDEAKAQAADEFLLEEADWKVAE
jgi:hypothetical protein